MFGWGEFHKGKNANIVYRFYRFIKEKNYIDLFNKEIIRDHIWVEDVAEVMYQAMEKSNMKSGIYNLGGNHPISLQSWLTNFNSIPMQRVNYRLFLR